METHNEHVHYGVYAEHSIKFGIFAEHAIIRSAKFWKSNKGNWKKKICDEREEK
jgi:hypothetical protein